MTASRPGFNIARSRFDAPPLEAALYLVATPIGNLGDITLRALETIAAADILACEDTRVTRKLLDRYGIARRTLAYHEHNAETQGPKLIAALREGKSVALVSDAGTPLVSDPGFKLVRAAVAADLPVHVVPGASSVLAALSLSGLPSDAFFFGGFLPVKSGARQARLNALKAVPGTLILFETAPRLIASLADMASVLGDRPAAVTRELTKKFEEARRGTLTELAEHYASVGPPKGEIVVVIGPPEQAEAAWDEARVDSALSDRVPAAGVKQASAEIAALSGWAKRDVYARALALKDRA